MRIRPLTNGFVIPSVALATIWVSAGDQQDNPEEMRETQNKAVVLRVYDEVFGQGRTDEVKDLFSKNYIQHNPMVQNGPEGLIGYVKMLKSQSPPPVLTVKHILVDGDLAVVHWHSSATPENESTGQAGFDLFRLDRGIIVEHWDMIQNVSTRTASGNSMFSDLCRYANGSQNVPETTERAEEANKQTVISAYDGLFNGRQLGLLDQLFAGPGYIQHNPQAANGTDVLRASLDAIFPRGSLLKIRHAVAEGDLVFTHSQGLMPGNDQNSEFAGTALGDLFRVVDGKIVEHWDVIQPVPATTASGNSMFSDLYKGAGA